LPLWRWQSMTSTYWTYMNLLPIYVYLAYSYRL
jgi:hypothetical protein